MPAVAEINNLLSSRDLSGLALSRATWFRGVQWPGAAEFIPVVGGQTVWEATPGESGRLLVVEQPNYFGRFELRVPVGENVVTVWRWGTLDGNPDLLVTDLRTGVGSNDTAKNLAGRLRQVPGVKLAHGRPASPWFIINLPGRADRTAAALASAGFRGCVPLGGKFPEFPGGMRIEVAWPQSENDRFAQTVRTAVEL